MASSLMEARTVWSHVQQARERGAASVLAEIVAVEGSAYRRPGALMMMAQDGKMTGTISGGCLEGDLFMRAEPLFAGGRPLLVDYDLAEDEMWSLGIGCKGRIKVWVRPADPDGAEGKWIARALAHGGVLAAELPEGKLVGWVPGEPWPHDPVLAGRMQAAWDGAEATWADGVYVRAWRPADRLVLVGAGHDAEPVARLAQEAGFQVTVVDPRTAFNDDRRFPGCRHLVSEARDLDPEAHPDLFDAYWVVMNHHKERDTQALAAAFRFRPRFVGALGPWQRTAEILAGLGTAVDPERVNGPVGLDIGAETPFEVAVSIVAELMARRRGRSGGSLNRRAKLHG
jgi:xanthine dehydrogenase accessory factor